MGEKRRKKRSNLFYKVYFFYGLPMSILFTISGLRIVGLPWKDVIKIGGLIILTFVIFYFGTVGLYNFYKERGYIEEDNDA